jgi:hypothetical protein
LIPIVGVPESVLEILTVMEPDAHTATEIEFEVAVVTESKVETALNARLAP